MEPESQTGGRIMGNSPVQGTSGGSGRSSPRPSAKVPLLHDSTSTSFGMAVNTLSTSFYAYAMGESVTEPVKHRFGIDRVQFETFGELYTVGDKADENTSAEEIYKASVLLDAILTGPSRKTVRSSGPSQ